MQQLSQFHHQTDSENPEFKTGSYLTFRYRCNPLFVSAAHPRPSSSPFFVYLSGSRDVSEAAAAARRCGGDAMDASIRPSLSSTNPQVDANRPFTKRTSFASFGYIFRACAAVCATLRYRADTAKCTWIDAGDVSF